MKSRRIDLHTHSSYSDGTSTPAEVVRRAHERRVEILALSDHDSVSGFEEALAAAVPLGLRVLCGVEINTRDGDNLHILGYGIDPSSEKLRLGLEDFRSRRAQRVRKIVERLGGLGLDVSWEDVQGASRQSLGRPHVADVLLRKGIVRSRKEAFERYLARGKPGYVAPMGPSVEDAIGAIRDAGGWSSLAHPGAIEDGDRLRGWVDRGLAGIETYYPAHTRETVRRLLDLARTHRLLPTGGSDYHGPGTGRDSIGGIEVDEELYGRLISRLG